MAPYAVPRQAPPVRPSRSLEGLEQVVPPRVSKPPASCVSVSRPSLHLDKPLPDLPTAPKPLPSTPSMAGGSTAWSDDSSVVDSIDTRPPSDAVSDDFPVVVRSGSDDLEHAHAHAAVESPSLDQIIDSYAKQPPLTTITSPPSINNPYLTDDYAYSSPSAAWTPRAGPNHYFREKKWDFFPELAPGSPVSTTFRTNKPRKTSSSRLNLSSPLFDRTKKNISTIKPWTSTSSPSDRSHAHSLAHDVRDSIRDLVHRRLSRHQSVVDRSKSHSKSTKRKPNPRPSTAPSECIFNINSLPRRKTPSSQYSERGCPLPYESALEVPLDRLSLSYSSSMEEESQSSNWNFSSSSRCSELSTQKKKKKQLAVPMSPYQKYGAAIFDRAGREKRKSVRPNRQVRFPRYYQKNIHGLVGLNVDVDMDMDGDVDGDGDEEEEEPPLSPSSGLQQKTREGVKALQDGTSQVLVKLDGARRRVVSAKIERKRSQLKAKIRVVGPVNPTTVYGDPWV